jgi:hypothetical protein
MNEYKDLNSNEIKVLKAVSLASIDSTGGEFTYFDEVIEFISDMKDNQVKGYLSQLVQKDYIHISDDEYSQISHGTFVDYLDEYKF